MATEQTPTSIIADDAVTTAKVADDAITGALIENNPTIAGNLTVSGTSTLTGALTASGGIANAGTITAGTLGSSVVVPASIGGSMHLIQKQTASDSSLIEFTTLGNHSAFTNLYFIFNEIKPTNDNVTFRSRIAETGTDYRDANYNHIAFYIERNFIAENVAAFLSPLPPP